MGVRDKLRHALNLHDTTPEGFKYQRVGEEIKITGFRPKLPITEIPADIDGLPVGIISGLQSIPFIIPNTVHTICDNALNMTKGITKIVLPDSVREIGYAAFSFSEALEEIVFPEGMDFIQTPEAVADGCPKLKTVSLPSTMLRVPTGFFSDCGLLEEIWIPDAVTEISDCAFMYDSSLKKVHLPSSLKIIKEMAFCDCSSLEEITLPNGMEIIEKSAFSGCENLKKIHFPSTLKHIGKNAFADCRNLMRPDIPSGCEVHEKAFDKIQGFA